MSKIKNILIAFFAIASVVSCKKDDPVEEVVSIVLSVNKESFAVGDVLTYSVVADGSNDVTNDAEVKLNNEIINNNSQLESTGDYILVANYKGLSSQLDIIVGPTFTIKVEGEQLNNNDVKVYSTVGENANMELAITNNTSGEISLRMALVSKTVPDSADALVCFDVCYPSIIERTVYPLNAAYKLSAGETSEPGKAHVQYNDISFGNAEFVFEVFQVDENLVKNGAGIVFTYKYVAP